MRLVATTHPMGLVPLASRQPVLWPYNVAHCRAGETYTIVDMHVYIQCTSKLLAAYDSECQTRLLYMDVSVND